jgi:hypothetical protein
MKYLLLVCGADDVTSPPPVVDPQPWVDEMDSRGIRLVGNRLCPEAEATTVRVRERGVLVTDGPHLETKDLIGGFDIIECADLDEAIEVAAKHPVATYGAIEVRPFWTE